MNTWIFRAVTFEGTATMLVITTALTRLQSQKHAAWAYASMEPVEERIVHINLADDGTPTLVG